MNEDTPAAPEFRGKPFYGYDSPDVQKGYANRDANSVADFLMPRLSSGMSLLDCGCGPGPLTMGLAEAVDPGRAVGIDIEPTMVEWAKRAAADRGISGVEFRVADVYDLPFVDGEFDVVFSSAVIEHLSDPVRALAEMRRVTKPGGIVAVIKTDWSFPFIVPECPEFSRFFELFEGGFNRIGGSLNRGRFLPAYMRDAGFEEVEFAARIASTLWTEGAKSAVEGYIAWVDNIPLFRESVELGETSDAELDAIRSGMREWASSPGAYVATAGVWAVGIKN